MNLEYGIVTIANVTINGK